MKNIRRFIEDQLVIATHNEGKLREIRALFDRFDFSVISAGSLNLTEPEETESSFRGNALLKARTAATAAKLPALADDSGLVVVALDGAPGIYSARWAGPDRDFDKAMQRSRSRKGGATAYTLPRSSPSIDDVAAEPALRLAAVAPTRLTATHGGRGGSKSSGAAA